MLVQGVEGGCVTRQDSRGFVPGPTVKLERAIHHILNYYLDSLLGEDESARRGRLEDGAQYLATGDKLYPEPIDAGYSKSFGKARA